MKIVVFDDVAMYVEAIAEVLGKAGHEILPIQILPNDSCEVVAQKIIAFKPDMIFADWSLKARFDGEELLKQIGGKFYTPELKEKRGNPRVVSISKADPDILSYKGLAFDFPFSAKADLAEKGGRDGWTAECLVKYTIELPKYFE